MSNSDVPIDLNNLADHVFLHGAYGTGKTTLAVARLRALLESGVAGDSIFVLAPQRSLLKPYQDELRKSDIPPGGQVQTSTLGGLARRSVDLAWPAVAEDAGFARPDQPPIFLNLESAQYHMERVARPLIEDRLYFDDVHLKRNRIYSQLLDGLNKAALVGFPLDDVGRRLSAAWSGKEARAIAFTQVQDCITRFRAYCLQNNLLDFSLQVDILVKYLLTADWFRDDLFNRYRHLIVDNVEEDNPVTHDLLRDWIPNSDSAVICYDADAGYRSFLGADPDSGFALREVCEQTIEFSESYVTSMDVQALEASMARVLAEHDVSSPEDGDARIALEFGGGRFHPQMLDWVTRQIDQAINGEGVPPEEIVVIVPFLSDALRFAINDRLGRLDIPTRSLRPSRALVEEPAARGLLTLAALAHPDWQIVPPRQDVAHALVLSLDNFDPARAYLLAERAYHIAGGAAVLRSFDNFKPDLQDRIGYEVGARYERLRTWLREYSEATSSTLDHFISRLFGEVLSQAGYGFHSAQGRQRFDRGRVAAQMISSARHFRQVVAPDPFEGADALSIGKPFVDMVSDGVIASVYVEPPGQKAQAVLLAPAYTFLLSNRPITIQYWLNAGSASWWERLYQPLTHPYVLSRRWSSERKWSDEEEQTARRDTLLRLVRGLLRRCRSKVVLAYSSLNEQGFEERGPLLTLVQQVLRES